jgi:hypothetical protein
VEFEGNAIPWEQFPDLLMAHLTKCPDTPEAEAAGAAFVADPSERNAVTLIYRTCYWGGSNGPRILPQIIKNNDPLALATHFSVALDSLKHGHGLRELIGALESVNKIHYLGQPSFASKMLRMLDGEHCGVLDSLVSGAAKYPLDQMSFALYSVTLQDIALELDRLGIPNPRGFEKWRAADADAAIFAQIRGWTPR